MKELLNKFEAKRPEIVFEWKDAETCKRAYMQQQNGDRCEETDRVTDPLPPTSPLPRRAYET